MAHAARQRWLPELRAPLSGAERSRTQAGAYPLHYAASKGGVPAVQQLVAAHCRLAAQSRGALPAALFVAGSGATPLHWAAERGSAASVRALLAAGLKPTPAMRPSLSTALHLAAAAGRAEACKALLEAKADPLARNADHRTPLHLACERGRLAAAAALAEGSTTWPAQPAAASPAAAAAVPASPARPGTARPSRRDAPLAEGSGGLLPGSSGTLHTPRGAPPQSPTHASRPNSALRASWPAHPARQGKPATTYPPPPTPEQPPPAVAAERARRFAAADSEGMTPLHAAAYHGHADVVRLLLTKGASPAAVEKRGRTPAELARTPAAQAALRPPAGWDLHGAARAGAAGEVGVALRWGTPVDGRNAELGGTTALHEAVKRGHFSVVRSQSRGAAGFRAGDPPNPGALPSPLAPNPAASLP